MSTILTYNLLKKDWPDVRRIYQAGIETGNATFELTVPDWPEWDASHLAKPRITAKIDNNIVGWAALSPVSDRCAYEGVAEVSVYVDPIYNGRGVGTILLERLVELSEIDGFWTLQAGIFPENKASIHIHEKCGFRTVGIRKRLGRLNGVWRDVILLEHRSLVVGI
jgi:phosphinothricin acetyltransferase